jgi:glycine cleavage system H protein
MFVEIEGYQFSDNLYYHKEHDWTRIDKSMVVMGITDLLQGLVGEITCVELPEEGHKLEQDEACGSLEPKKWVGRVYAVVSGTVSQANKEREDMPELIKEGIRDRFKVIIRGRPVTQ